MFLNKPKKSIFWPVAIIVFIAVFAVLMSIGFLLYRNVASFFSMLQTNRGSSALNVGQITEDSKSLFTRLLGFSKPTTYLFLFENNTEMRPGGGFIGSYAVVKIDGGKPEIVKVEGVEKLDNAADTSVLPLPPAPIKKYLGVNSWFMRDSNWSPDFPTSAEQALKLYRDEGGASAPDVSVVVAITPTVIERLLRLTGNITVDNLVFTPENVTKQLEYNVEYGFRDTGTSFTDRKKILEPFARALSGVMLRDFFLHSDKYSQLFEQLAVERHIMIYAEDPSLQKIISDFNISGTVAQTAGDYLLWVDANLGALKSDYALDRHLTYSLAPAANGDLTASATMSYAHTGTFDWRTTRYRTYARVFVPSGSTLLSIVEKNGRGSEIKHSILDTGSELGKTWFGTFVSIEPQTTSTLMFEYKLPKSVAETIQTGLYTLFVQKQLGTIAHTLTLDLNFGTNVKAATPAEEGGKWGDAVYEVQSDLSQDRSFKVNF